MTNKIFAPFAFVLGILLCGGPWVVATETTGVFLSEEEQKKADFFDQFFDQHPSDTRAQIRENLKQQIQEEISSIRFAPQVMGGLTPKEQQMLDQLNSLAPQTESPVKLELFRLKMMRRLSRPWLFFQSKLDNNPSLNAYVFRPTLEALHTKKKFVVSTDDFPPQTATIQEILGTLFEQTSPRSARNTWDMTPMFIEKNNTQAVLWFSPAIHGDYWLEVKINFSTHLIFADLTSAPSFF